MAIPQRESAAPSRFEAVIGLEVHVQLLTKTKLFCSCRNRFGDPPNTHVCPVCLGLPGALPVLSRQAVTLALRAAIATGCKVQRESVFARKNYFYPDLPKGYQISQYEKPLAIDGAVVIPSADGTTRPIHLVRIHMEEDAGKLLHEGFSWSGEKSGVDINRAGVPLVEIVSAPEIHTPAEAWEYLTALREVLLYAGVSDCNMEEGSLRCDANVSIRPRGVTTLGIRAEIKNLNSFRNVQRAIEHEIARQIAVVESGGTVVQQTRLWNADKGETAAMRSKEEAHDYRYFPEPDLPILVVEPAWVDDVRESLPELPAAKRLRLVAEYGLPEYDASVLTQSREVADYFETAARLSGNAKAASNWVMNEVLRMLKEQDAGLEACRVEPPQLAALIGLVEGGTINGRTAKDVFLRMWETGEEPGEIVKREGLVQVTDEGPILAAIEAVLSSSPTQVDTYRNGKTSTLGWFVGQVMRRTGGKASPQLVGELLRKALERS